LEPQTDRRLDEEDVMTWMIAAILLVAFFLVFRRFAVFRRLPPELAAIGAALVVSASSVYELATASPEAETRRLVYAALLGAMAMVIVYALRQRGSKAHVPGR
jgi:hypothetical protein